MCSHLFLRLKGYTAPIGGGIVCRNRKTSNSEGPEMDARHICAGHLDHQHCAPQQSEALEPKTTDVYPSMNTHELETWVARQGCTGYTSSQPHGSSLDCHNPP